MRWRAGSFTPETRGTYEGGTAATECSVVPGSGTGGLAGVTGEGRCVARHADHPNVKFSMEYRSESGG